jgi:hypothetical protein
MSAYLRFEHGRSPSEKTAVVRVYSLRSGDLLGQIRWMGRWRQYAFYPENLTIWNPDCLADISGEIAALMSARRAA